MFLTGKDILRIGTERRFDGEIITIQETLENRKIPFAACGNSSSTHCQGELQLASEGIDQMNDIAIGGQHDGLAIGTEFQSRPFAVLLFRQGKCREGTLNEESQGLTVIPFPGYLVEGSEIVQLQHFRGDPCSEDHTLERR